MLFPLIAIIIELLSMLSIPTLATSTAASMMTSSSTATATSSGSMAERLILGPSLLIMAVVIGLSL